MFKKLLVRLVVVGAAATSGGIVGAALQSSGDAGASSVAPAVTTSASNGDSAVLHACGGRSVIDTLTPQQSAQVDDLLQARALHVASLGANPLDGGVDYQAGVDDALHIQSIDRDLTSTVCPTP